MLDCFSGNAVEDTLGVAWMFEKGGQPLVGNTQPYL